MVERPLSVTDFKRKDGIVKHVQYAIQGTDPSGPINITRRYKDFTYLRKLLVSNWPGCFVPQIPPKQMIGNLDEDFIERRKKLLDRFIKQVVSLPHLNQSEEFQKFLRTSGDFFKSEMIPKNYIQIAEIFHKAFNEFYFAEVHGNQAIEFQNYISFCSVALPAFEKFEKVCKATASCYEKINSSQNVLMQSLQQVNSFCTKNYSSKLVQVDEKEEMCNSFLLVLDWARGEILDLKAMLEGIQKQLGFAKQYEYFREKLLQKQKGLEGLKQGKKSISSVFSTKSADVQQKTQKKSVESLEYDLKGLELIERINAERLLKIELPLFKQKKVQSLSSVLKLFGESIHTELEKYRNQTRILEASLNNNND